MRKKADAAAPHRRHFLRAAAGVPAAAVAVVLRPEEAAAYDPGQQETKARYRGDSADVQAFYRTNGYETLKK